MSYAAETGVPVDRSQREIEQLVRRAGARTFYRGEDLEKAFVAFDLNDRRILFELPLPQSAEYSFGERRGRKVKLTPQQSEQLQGQATRAKWRALALTIKAKLVSVESRIETVEEAFLAQVVISDARGNSARFAKFAELAIKKIYEKGLPALPGPAGGTVEPLQLPSGKDEEE